MIVRALRRLLSADFIGLTLVFGALQALTYGIASSLRNTDTKYFFWICLLGALLAFGLSKWDLRGVRASLLIIAIGTAGVWFLGARLTTPLLGLGDAIRDALPQIIPAIRLKTPLDTAPLTDAWLVVVQASNGLSARVQTWLMGLNQNVTVNDPLVRNMAWVLIMWLISAWMGWFAGRRQAIAALLPSMLLLAFITSYSERRVETLWTMVFVLLLLMGIWNYRNHTAQWERRKVDYSDSIRYDVTQAVLLLSIAIGALAFITPSISWREIRDFLQDRGKNELAETLGVQQQPVAAQPAPTQKPALPRDHLLSGGYAQSEQIVMTIRTGELPPVANPAFADDAPRYYWRSTTYDIYVGAGWLTSAAPPQRYEANTPLIPGLLNGYKTLHLDVQMLEPEGKLFWSGILFSADVPIRADWRLRPQSNLFTDQAALLQSDLFAAASTASAYQAESYVPQVTIEELRAASTTYPNEIQDRYLPLPRSVPERVLHLAQEITEGKTTPYDKAKAIESYLRTYPYDLNVPAPPQDQDVADYFLFDLKKGYCDYYATAMVVLARASGLPARFVSGYAPGSYDAANAEYIVRELHAHSWPEVYFPEIGWIEFEPTAAQPEIDLPLSENETDPAQPDETAKQLLNRFRLEQLFYWLSPLLILVVGFVLYFLYIERWIYLRLAPAIAIEKIYRQLYRVGRPLAGERAQAETAYEFMGKLVNKIDDIEERSRFGNYLFETTQDIEGLATIYQKTLFAQHPVNQEDVRIILNQWKHLRVRLWIARLHDCILQMLSSERISRLFIHGERVVDSNP